MPHLAPARPQKQKAMEKLQKATRIKNTYKAQIIAFKYGEWPIYFQNWLNRILTIDLLITDLKYKKP